MIGRHRRYTLLFSVISFLFLSNGSFGHSSTCPNTIETDQNIFGVLETKGDQHCYQITMMQGNVYEISMNSHDMDALLYVTDSNGKVLIQNGTQNCHTPQLTFFPEKSAVYYLFAGAYGDGGTGTYTLSVHTYTYIYTDYINVNETLEGSLEKKGDRNIYQVYLNEGSVYQIDMISHENEIDPYLYLADGTAQFIDRNDDNDNAGADASEEIQLGAQIVFSPETTGNYYIVAASSKDKGFGTYSLSIREGVHLNFEAGFPSKIIGEVEFSEPSESLEGIELHFSNEHEEIYITRTLPNGMFKCDLSGGVYRITPLNPYYERSDAPDENLVTVLNGDAEYVVVRLSQSPAPALDLRIRDTTHVTLSWHDAMNSDGYLLYYSATDQMDADQYIDMGKQETLEFDADGWALSVQVRSYTGRYQSALSNIVSFDLR